MFFISLGLVESMIKIFVDSMSRRGTSWIITNHIIFLLYLPMILLQLWDRGERKTHTGHIERYTHRKKEKDRDIHTDRQTETRETDTYTQTHTETERETEKGGRAQREKAFVYFLVRKFCSRGSVLIAPKNLFSPCYCVKCQDLIMNLREIQTFSL